MDNAGRHCRIFAIIVGMNAAATLAALGGCATFGSLAERCGRRAVRTGLADGTIRRISRGVYALPPTLTDLAVACSHRGVLSHESAALYWGFGVVDRPGLPHVTIPRHRHRRPSREPVVLHWADAPAIDDVTTPLRTIVDCARTLPFGPALAIADSAVRARMLSRAELLDAGHRLRRAGRSAVIRVAEHLDGRSESVLESMLRAILIEAGFDEYVPQVQIGDARVDLADPVRRIVLEADSFEFHGTRRALVRDCRRYVGLVVRGWTVLRFTWEDVVHDPNWVVKAVEAVHSCGQNSRLRAA